MTQPESWIAYFAPIVVLLIVVACFIKIFRKGCCTVEQGFQNFRPEYIVWNSAATTNVQRVHERETQRRLENPPCVYPYPGRAVPMALDPRDLLGCPPKYEDAMKIRHGAPPGYETERRRESDAPPPAYLTALDGSTSRSRSPPPPAPPPPTSDQVEEESPAPVVSAPVSPPTTSSSQSKPHATNIKITVESE